jgi:hypothetical protein
MKSKFTWIHRPTGDLSMYKKGDNASCSVRPGCAGNLFTCASYNTAFCRLRGTTGKSYIYKKGNTVGEVSYGMSSCSTLDRTVAIHRAPAITT